MLFWCVECSQISEVSHIFKRLTGFPHFVVLSCILFWRPERVFWGVTPCYWANGSDVSKGRVALALSGLLDPEDGGSTALRNVKKHPHNYTASRLRRLVSLAAPLQCLAICRLQYLSAVTAKLSS